MIPPELLARFEAEIGVPVVAVEPLGGGCVAEVGMIILGDGRRLVVKALRPSDVATEAWMLTYLRRHSRLPVPGVLHAADGLLVVEHVDNDGQRVAPATDRHAADLLAELHAVTAVDFGLERDTLIGGLDQPNEPSTSWVEFFRDRRLVFMGRRALAAGGIGSDTFSRLERVAARVGEWIEEPPTPALLHGDVWSGNVLLRGGRIAAFVDPAIYFGHPEVELAFIALFSTFGDAFFARYRERGTLAAGFFELRCDIYNLYPLLVHAALFGSSYGARVDRIARRLVG